MFTRGFDRHVANKVDHKNSFADAYLCASARFPMSRQRAETSQDAYITTHGTEWTLGSAAVEITIALRNGMLVTTGFKNKANGHELAPSDSTGPWTLVDAKTSKLKQGELQLDLTLRREGWPPPGAMWSIPAPASSASGLS